METTMPHNYRREGSGRFEHERGGRTHSDRERYRVHDEDRYSPRDDSNFNRDYDSDRSYYGESPDQDREDRPWSRRDRDVYERGPEQSAAHWRDEPRDRSGSDEWRPRDNNYSQHREQQAGGGRFSSPQQNRWRDERNDRGGSPSGSGLLHWRDQDTDENYFGTGGNYGAYSTGPGARASGSAYEDPGYLGASRRIWHDRPMTWSEDDDRSAGSSGSSEMYAGSRYGAQGGYDRPYGPVSSSQRAFGQDYREQFAEQRYGRNPEFGYGYESNSHSATFRGRGPKGYERSDDRLREIICERLTDDPRIDATDVHIEVKDKIVKLTGTVSNRRSKYEIEDVVERCGGVKDIDNQVRVRSGTGMTQSSGSAIRSNQQTFNEGIANASSSDTDTKSAASRSSATKRSS
jgi:osmotically-inducible protein OsmY